MYILYKNPTQLDTLYIVQYLFSIGINLQPQNCIEKSHPIDVLPSIYDIDTQKWYLGITEVIKFYEVTSGINDLLGKARKFKQENPNYRIHSN